MEKIKLSNVTLLAPTGNHIPETIDAINKCCESIDFAAVKLITHQEHYDIPSNVVLEKSLFPMDTYYNYNKYVFEYLFHHFHSTHCIVMQYDSWILHPELWDIKWLEYDYIGAPWPIKDDSYIAWGSNEHVRVGNGGFSLRSRKLTELPNKLGLHLTDERGYFNEDGNTTCYHRIAFLNSGIKYAPVEVAAKFSFETLIPENYGVKTFAFHKNMPWFAWS